VVVPVVALGGATGDVVREDAGAHLVAAIAPMLVLMRVPTYAPMSAPIHDGIITTRNQLS
jgi:hypothetical protein